MGESAREDYIAEQDLDEMYEHAADNLEAWLAHPCAAHLFWVGCSVGAVLGFDPMQTLEAAADIVRRRIDAGDLVLPPGSTPFVIADLELMVWVAQ